MSQFSLLHYLPQCSFSLAQFLVFYDCRRSPSLRVGAAIFLPFHKVSGILGSFILFAAIILLLNFFGAILFLLRRFPSFFSVIMGAAISLYFHNACAIFLSFIFFPQFFCSLVCLAAILLLLFVCLAANLLLLHFISRKFSIFHSLRRIYSPSNSLHNFQFSLKNNFSSKTVSKTVDDQSKLKVLNCVLRTSSLHPGTHRL